MITLLRDALEGIRRGRDWRDRESLIAATNAAGIACLEARAESWRRVPGGAIYDCGDEGLLIRSWTGIDGRLMWGLISLEDAQDVYGWPAAEGRAE